VSAGRYGVSRPAGTISFASMIIVHMPAVTQPWPVIHFGGRRLGGSISVIQHFHEAAQIEIDKAVDLYKAAANLPNLSPASSRRHLADIRLPADPPLLSASTMRWNDQCSVTCFSTHSCSLIGWSETA
jgi:hypothetical protein